MYQPPIVKVVSFQVEGGFAGSLQQNGTAENNLIDFGGYPQGQVTHDANDHSGLGYFENGGSLF